MRRLIFQRVYGCFLFFVFLFQVIELLQYFREIPLKVVNYRTEIVLYLKHFFGIFILFLRSIKSSIDRGLSVIEKVNISESCYIHMKFSHIIGLDKTNLWK